MNIAIDISPLKNGRFLKHRVRGTGFYIENLKSALQQYYPNNQYNFFVRGEKLPKNIDLVHYPYFEPFFRTLPVIKKHKTVVTVHDLTPLVFKEYFPVGVKGNVKWQIQKLALKASDSIITDSECSKNDIIEYTGISSSKIYVVHLAASEEFRKMEKSSILGSIRKKYKLPEKFVLYVGDVTWNKNLPRFIEAIKKINLMLVMVGSALVQKDFDRTNPWNQDLLKVQKMIENDKRFTKLGFAPTEDLVAIYNLATVFAMPSLYEGFGLPVLEAMSCGCPVITSKEGSIKEVAGNAALFVDAYNINDIANGIGKIYFSPKLQKEFCQSGLKQAQKFSWRKTAKDTVKVYEKNI